MKKRRFSIAVLGLLLVMVWTAGAYELPELNMTVEVPEGWIVFTRDIETDDPNAAAMELDADKLRQYMLDADIYLDAVNGSYSNEFVITMAEYDGSAMLHSFSEFSERELAQAMERLMESGEAEADGLAYTEHFFYKHNGITFIVLDFVQENAGLPIYGRQYYTIYNGQAINLTMRGYLGELSDGMLDIHKQMVDSVQFTKTLENPTPHRRGEDRYIVFLITAGVVGVVIVGIAVVLHRKKKRRAARRASPMPPAGSASS